MLTKIEIRAFGTAPALTLDVVVPNASTRYLVHNVEGLGPVKSSISTAPLGKLNGTDYTGSSVAERNIVIDFEYKPNYAMAQSVYHLRQELYSFAGPEKHVELTLHIDGVGLRTIEGYVESVESPMFSKEVTGQISIICPIPWFAGQTVARSEAPETNITINYPGDIPTGPVIVYNTPSVGNSALLRMENTHPTTGLQTLAVNTMFPSNRIMTFDFRDRQKTALQWDGRNLIPFLEAFSWWKLHPGNNVVRFSGRHQPGGAETTGPLPATPKFDITYTVLYGGL